MNLETLEYFHIISNDLPEVGHLDGLLSTENSLFIADISPSGGFGNATKDTGKIYKVAAKNVATTQIEQPGSGYEPLSIDLFPNPARAETHIHLRSQTPTRSSVFIYDIMGRLIRNLGEHESTSQITWNGTNDEGKPVATGVYILVVQNSTILYKKGFAYIK